MKGLHVVIVPAWWPSPEAPARGIFFTDYALAFAKAGARVGVIVPDLVSMREWRRAEAPWRRRVTEESLQGIPVIRIRGRHTAFGRPALHMRRFRAWLRRGLTFYQARHGEPQILHAMCAIPSGWACTHLDDLGGPDATTGLRPGRRRPDSRPPPRSLPAPVVVTEHTGPFSLVMRRSSEARLVRAALDKAAAVVAVSDHLHGQMRAEGITRKILVRGNAAAREFLESEISNRPSHDPSRALFVGRLTAEKGIPELIDAAIRLHRAGAAIEWQFVGDGPLRGMLSARFQAAGLGQCILLHGQRARPEVVRIMSQCDFLVLPSHGESFGMAVAEALCMGLPVVTTRDTACAEFVDDSNGVLVDPKDVRSLEVGVCALVAKFQSYDRAAIAAAARNRFSPAGLAQWYEQLFRRLPNAPQPTPRD